MNPLHEMIRRLPTGVEFLVVVSWAFGLPIMASIMSLGTGGEVSAASGGTLVFNNAALVNVVVFELVQSIFLVWFLKIRGWTLEKLGLAITWRGTGWGWMLMLATYVLLMAVHTVADWTMPAAQMHAAVARLPAADKNLSMELVFLASTVNGIFEEVFVAGYIITALREQRGMWTAINVSTVVRLLYHLYQGPLGILSVVPMGLLYGYFFARSRLLWPLILAHVLIDIVALSSAKWS